MAIKKKEICVAGKIKHKFNVQSSRIYLDCAYDTKNDSVRVTVEGVFQEKHCGYGSDFDVYLKAMENPNTTYHIGGQVCLKTIKERVNRNNLIEGRIKVELDIDNDCFYVWNDEINIQFIFPRESLTDLMNLVLN
ncbi:MAG: hypothetical protein FWE82_03370 [Defluviitaleaceae bacterium]|nr:hypothetical protein [Defluviitaleaceae bacterium]